MPQIRLHRFGVVIGGEGRLGPGSFGIGLDGQRQDRWETRAVARNGHNVRIPITNGRTEMATEDLKARLETLAQTITLGDKIT